MFCDDRIKSKTKQNKTKLEEKVKLKGVMCFCVHRQQKKSGMSGKMDVLSLSCLVTINHLGEKVKHNGRMNNRCK